MNILATSPASIARQLQDIEETLASIEIQLRTLPEGTANVSQSGGRIRMTGMLNGKRHVFNQSESPLVKQLLLRKYLTKKKQELEHARATLKHYMNYADHWLGSSEHFLMDNPLSAGLLKEHFAPADEPLFIWADRPDTCAAPNQETRTEETLFGLKVRSKSEVMIATYLFENELPFRYEEPLHIRGKTYYPDFTIRDPKSGAYYWLEHFGKMDDDLYIRKALNKLYNYIMAGIVPGINLITTYETKENKLNLPQIAAAIESVL